MLEPAYIPLKAYINSTFQVSYLFSGTPAPSDFDDLQFEVPGLVVLDLNEGTLTLDTTLNKLSARIESTVMADADPRAYRYRIWATSGMDRFPIVHGEFAVEEP
jgi:hypothetical protein